MNEIVKGEEVKKALLNGKVITWKTSNSAIDEFTDEYRIVR